MNEIVSPAPQSFGQPGCNMGGISGRLTLRPFPYHGRIQYRHCPQLIRNLKGSGTSQDSVFTCNRRTCQAGSIWTREGRRRNRYRLTKIRLYSPFWSIIGLQLSAQLWWSSEWDGRCTWFCREIKIVPVSCIADQKTSRPIIVHVVQSLFKKSQRVDGAPSRTAHSTLRCISIVRDCYKGQPYKYSNAWVFWKDVWYQLVKKWESISRDEVRNLGRPSAEDAIEHARPKVFHLVKQLLDDMYCAATHWASTDPPHIFLSSTLYIETIVLRWMYLKLEKKMCLNKSNMTMKVDPHHRRYPIST